MEPISFDLPGQITAKYRFYAANSPDALLIVPAMGVAARAYDSLAQALAKNGISSLVMEHAGGPESSFEVGPKTDAGYGEVLGAAMLARDFLKTRYRVHFLGHSLGAQLLVSGAGQLVFPDSKMIVIAGGTVHWKAFSFPANCGVYLATHAAKLISFTLGYFPGHRLGFGGLQPKQLIVDWAQASRTGTFCSRGISLEINLHTVKNELLALFVEGDNMAPQSALNALVVKLTRAKVVFETVVPDRAPKKMNAHFRWLKNPENVATRVARFISGKTP